MPAVSLADAAAPIGDAAVVVGVHQTPNGPELAPGAERVEQALGGRLSEGLCAVGATGKPDEVIKVPTLGLADFPVVVAAGLGRDGLEPERVRRAVGAALRAVNTASRVWVAIGTDDQLASAIAEGALLGAYRFTAYKSNAPRPKLRRVDIAVGKSARGRAALKRARLVAEAVNTVRDLVNTPPNDLYPAAFAERARQLGEEAGLTVELLDERALKRGGFGGILGVGSGSARPPRLVRLHYRPRRARAKVALVGKGVTFDSGGLNIKSQLMTWMKSDMGGAAAAIAASAVAARLDLPIEITTTVPMAENMPSGTSYRPSDILTLRGGKTVEVLDTDNEGRLILADAIVRALEDGPEYLLEASTLTAGQMIGLGMKLIGAMGEPGLRDRVAAAGNRVGEAVWAMPLPEELRGGLDTPTADIANAAAERWGSMLIAGHFLADFMNPAVPWVHLDIAGPAWNAGGPHGYTPKGGTGAAVRTLVAALEDLSS